MKNALQFVENFRDDALAAAEALEFARSQSDFLGGRVLESNDVHPGHRLQVFFVDSDEEWLPDGFRRVVLPRGLGSLLG